MQNRSVPLDTILPHLVYDDVSLALAWLKRTFGFKEEFRYGSPVAGAQMQAGRGYIMLQASRAGLATPLSLGRQSSSLTVLIDDVELQLARAVKEGAQVVEALNQTVYGELQFAVLDLAGHRWIFSRHASDLAPEDWGAQGAPDQASKR